MKNNNSVRVVIDTNVFVSAIISGGSPRKVIDMIADETCTIVVAHELISDLKRIVTTKFPDFIEDLIRVEKLLERDALWVKLGSVRQVVSRDKDDDKFIETALIGNCQYIISGDKDLLSLGTYRGIKIVKPAEFLKLGAD